MYADANVDLTTVEMSVVRNYNGAVSRASNIKRMYAISRSLKYVYETA